MKLFKFKNTDSGWTLNMIDERGSWWILASASCVADLILWWRSHAKV